MSVTDGENVDAATTNAAFISRDTDSNTVAKVDFENADAASGDSIFNIQKEVNEKTYTNYGLKSIASGGTITPADVKGLQLYTVVGSSGPQIASSTPFGTTDTNWKDGMSIILIGTDDTDTVAFVHNDTSHGMLLNGGITLKKGYLLEVIWLNSMKRFVEKSRNS